MQKPDTWYAYFQIRGSFEPNDITRKVGIEPTEIARQGDAIGSSSQRRLCSLWALHSRLESSADLEEQVRNVLDQLDGSKPMFQAISRDFGGTMQLVGYFHDVNPGVHFDNEVVRRIADYSLCIDCDFYIC